MNLAQMLIQVRANTARHPTTFAAARARQPALTPFEGAATALDALRPASPLDAAARSAIVGALLEEHQRGPNVVWQSTLACAFEPMLLKLRRRIGRPHDEDYDQHVVVAFSEALRSSKPSAYVLLAIRRATEESLFRALRKERHELETVSYDPELHASDPFGPEAQARLAAVTIAEVFDARRDPELFDAFVATYVNEESLRDYVARTRANDGEAVQEAAYQRLWRARSVVTTELRERLGAPKRPRAQGDATAA